MTIWQSLLLGILQGLTEFLPVSSSGHLILASSLFEIDSDIFFDVMLHFGTLLAVFIVYFKSIIGLFRKGNYKKLLYLIIASIPTFVLALLVKLFVSEKLLCSLLPIGFALTIVMLTLSHYLGKDRVALTDKPLPAIITGVVQGIAVLPGLSRSGSTISTLRLFGVRAEECAEFSFLMSIPVIAGSVAVECYGAFSASMTVNWLNVAVGMAAAALSGLLAIKIVKKALQKANFIWFAVYLVIPLLLSIIIL